MLREAGSLSLARPCPSVYWPSEVMVLLGSLWRIMLSCCLTVLGNPQMVHYLFPVHCEHFRCFLLPGGHNIGIIVGYNHYDSCSAEKPSLSTVRCYLGVDTAWSPRGLTASPATNLLTANVHLPLPASRKRGLGRGCVACGDCCPARAPPLGSVLPLSRGRSLQIQRPPSYLPSC